jgi:membrane-associated phospholipid phosphatase
MFRAWTAIVLAMLCWSASAQAKEAEQRDVYTVKPWVDGSVIVVGGLANILPLALGPEIIDKRCPCSLDELNALDVKAVGNNNGAARTISDVTIGLAIAAPFVVDYFDVGWNRTLLNDSIVFAETLVVNSAFTTMFKFTVQRPLPIVYALQSQHALTSVQGYLAFYSGHTSTTFAALSAMSMTLTLRHGFSPWPWLITALVGTSVAVERVAAGQHFYTDVIVGAIMGTAVGVLVPWLHASSRWGTPTAGVDGGAVVVGWRRNW